MTATSDKIKAALARNNDLLRILSDTDHAETELSHQDRFINELEDDIDMADKQVAAMDEKRKKEFKEHQSYRDSVMRRFAYKVARKSDQFQARAEKEEREYFEALQEEHKAKTTADSLKAQLEQAYKVREHLAGEFRRHTVAQQDLDALYDQIFDGPSEGMPDEDAAESRRTDAHSAYRAACDALAAESKAVQELQRGQGSMRVALSSMDGALKHSRTDMFGGGTLSDMMERNALQRAQVQLSEAKRAVQHARQFSPYVEPLPDVNLPHANIMSDVFFDNIVSDMAFHEKIKHGMAETRTCANFLESQLGQARTRKAHLEADVARTQSSLEKARSELQKIRQRAFETYASYSPEGVAAVLK